MKRRITREHDARQGYGGVYWEGGGAITDADLNAAFDANREKDEALARVWVAPAGSADDGWRAGGLRNVAGMVDFDLAAGHYLLDGDLLRNPQSYAFIEQPHGLSAALEPDMALDWPAEDEIADAGGERFDAVVIDSRTLAVTVVEDSELDEVAMRSDPATRVRPSPKVRILPGVSPSCAEARPQVMDLLAGDCAEVELPSPAIRPRGRLRVHLGTVEEPDNPCAPEQALGYFGRLNHTIKVMLTAPDRFVWAYRNGGELYRATLDDDATLRIVTPFDDSSRFPVSGQIAELLTWDSRLPNGEVTAAPLGRFHAIQAGYTPGDETLELAAPVDTDLRDWYDAQGDGTFLFVRFWEPPAIAMQTSTATGADVPLADTGVRLDFVEAGCAGDQWTFSVRANVNDSVFPQRMLEAGGQPPGDIRRAADLIALIHWQLEGGEVVGHIHDCRRKIRPLWKLRGCCTVTVGNGVSSFGDVDRLEDAIAALPHEGGRICLLPGIHTGGAALRNRIDITIEGCRGQTRLVQGPGDGPALTIEDCAGVTIRDFTIEDGNRLAVAAARTSRLTLERIDTVGRGSAISLVDGSGTRVGHSHFLAEEEAAIIPAEDYAALRPLAFVGGEDLVISDNRFRCDTSRLTLMSLGGLQIASGSRGVTIARNVIRGGLGHGVTLCHLNLIRVLGLVYGEAELVAELGAAMMQAVDERATWSENSREATVAGSDLLEHGEVPSEAARELISNATFSFIENPIGITQVALQGCLGIDPTLTLPEPDDDDDDWTLYVPAGAVSHVHIVDNEIANMGGSGISIPSWNLSLRPTAGECIVEGLAAERNHIANCARVAVASTLDDDLQEIGFGGIALQVVRGAMIGSNIIQGIGTGHRSPSAGIYFSEVQTCHIHDNQILEVGRLERSGNRNILGVSGGILIDGATSVWGPPVTGGSIRDYMAEQGNLSGEVLAAVGEEHPASGGSGAGMVRDGDFAARAESIAQLLELPRTEALRIQNNQVAVNSGMSLDVRGAGSFHIADNHLTTLAARLNPARPRLASAVSVVNSEFPFVETLVWLMALFRIFEIEFGKFGSNYLLQILVAATTQVSAQRDRGVIQLQNNHIRTENFVRGDDSLALVTVVSPYDVQISDNTLKSVHSDTGAFLHLLATGALSLQCLSNRIESRPQAGVLGAALTAGRDNTTFLNHASHGIAQMRLTPAAPSGPGNIHP
ncbi:right-handed parallel beta-helix repeat-containing protein [Halomonas stenophila]|uniref:Right handed beta helix domain-containing protein n=1 Tax=Halomonas stenophila TaxID=795312 RepID=A0A7W5EVM4_9GAMM|nr:right-handed parallel beta-helix repeat-containing protein [Halomonas stenophila]MBB3232259.1 hypothetical protein [Halomonas stenophila]